MAGIQYLTQKAFLYKKPLVICIGLGSNQGSRTESMPLTFTLRRLGQIRGSRLSPPPGMKPAAPIIIWALRLPAVRPMWRSWYRRAAQALPWNSGDRLRSFFCGIPIPHRRDGSKDSGIPQCGNNQQFYSGRDKNLRQI